MSDIQFKAYVATQRKQLQEVIDKMNSRECDTEILKSLQALVSEYDVILKS